MRFDWYSATMDADHSEVIAELLPDLGSVKPSRPFHGYQHGAELVRGDRKFCSVWWGGNGGGVHVQSSGEEAPVISARLREVFPKHRVTRADVCEDYSAPGAWDVLAQLALEVADAEGIKVHYAGDWHRCEDGRTLYLGSPSSVARGRLYEKGRQLGRDPNLVRAELCVRPKGDSRQECATALPAQLWGSARWSQQLASRLGMGDIERMRCGTVYRDSDVERTRNALARQYGPALLAWADQAGSAEQLGRELLDRVRELRSRRWR